MGAFDRLIFVAFTPSPDVSFEHVSIYRPGGESAIVGSWRLAEEQVEVDDAGAEQLARLVDPLAAVPDQISVAVDVGPAVAESRWRPALERLLASVGVLPQASFVRVTDTYRSAEGLWRPDQELRVAVDPSVADDVAHLEALDRVHLEVLDDRVTEPTDADVVVLGAERAVQLKRGIESRRSPRLAFLLGDPGAGIHVTRTLPGAFVVPTEPSSISPVLDAVGTDHVVDRIASASEATAVGPTFTMLELAGRRGNLFDYLGITTPRERFRFVGGTTPHFDVTDTNDVTDAMTDERRVDMELRIGGASIRRSSPCRSMQRYTLALRIGMPYDATLFAVPPPDITDALGEEDEPMGGWDLDIAVFGHDFALAGPSVRSLHLPYRGPSEERTFVLVAPSDTARSNRFRVAIFRHNNLVQSFVARWGRAGVHLTLESRHIASFDAAERLAPRRLCLATNRDEVTGEHTLLALVDEAIAIDLDGPTVTRFLGDITGTLDGAVKRTNTTLWFPDTEPSERNAKFHETACQLARTGRELFLALFGEAPPPLKARLGQVMSLTDEPVQTVRLHPDLTVPWALVYDRLLPQRLFGDAEPTMCTDLDCNHDPTSVAYCIKGFWGIRLIIEELDPKAPRTGQPLQLERPPHAGRIVVATDSASDAPPLVAELTKSAGAGVERFTAGKDALLDALWSVEPPTSAVVLVGHVAPGGSRVGWPTEPYLVLDDGPEPQWLVVHDVVEHQIHARGGRRIPDPGPLVLVLGCKTEATELATVGSLPGDFLTAGAGSVVSTLCSIHVGFARDFAAQLLADMLGSGTPLGAAFQRWRRRIVAAGNPLPLALVATGETDLAFAAGST